MWAPSIDFRHYIGYFVGAFCVAVYAAIFIHLQGRRVRAQDAPQGDKETMRAGGSAVGPAYIEEGSVDLGCRVEKSPHNVGKAADWRQRLPLRTG